MDFPTPVNLIVKAVTWVWQRVTKALLHKTYVRSHQKWSFRHRLGSRWQPLGEHLEYSVRLAQPTDPKPHVSRLALRSTGQTLATVDLYFEAEGAGLRYQDKISLCNVDRTPIICSLLNVPVLEFIAARGEGFAFSVEEFGLRQCVVRLPGGELLPPRDSVRSFLTQSWLMSDDWVHRWGHWWNCNAIKFAKGEIALHWRFCWLPRSYSPFAGRPRRKSITRLLSAGFERFLTLRFLVTAQFWMAIWSGIWVMDHDDRLRLRWRVEHQREGGDQDLG